MTPNWAKKLLTLLTLVEAVASTVAFCLIAGLLIADVALREMTGTSMYGAQRISVYAMILIGFLGIGLATAKGRHLRPRFVDRLLPDNLVHFAARLGDAVMAITWLVFAFLGINFVREAREFDDLAHLIEIPLWLLYLVVPYAFAAVAARHIVFALFSNLRPEEALFE